MTEPIPVIWWTNHSEIDARGPWDTHILEELFDGRLWPTSLRFQHVDFGWGARTDSADFAIVVVPARHHTSPEDIAALNELLNQYNSVLLILCGDEEAAFPWRDIVHPRIRFWIQMADPEHYQDLSHVIGFRFGNGVPHGSNNASQKEPKTVWWTFSGQDTNPNRHVAVEAMRSCSLPGEMITTEGFAQGLGEAEYSSLLERSWFAPCPAGPVSFDTFRLYEALAHGCVPVVTRSSLAYWGRAFGTFIPFLIVNDDWSNFDSVVTRSIDDRHRLSALCSSWWQQQKRAMVRRLESDIERLTGEEIAAAPVGAIVTTSPVPINPDFSHLKVTVDSVRHHFGDCDVVIACDGVRSQQRHLEANYNKFLYELCRWTSGERAVVPLIAPQWLHQAMLTHSVLAEIDMPPLLLFMEHDAPLVDDMTIDTDACIEVLLAGHLDVIRFHHESHILEPHQHLMRDRTTMRILGLPIRRTEQWSQRPHLARRDYYERIMGNFTSESRTMIEDKMHSVCQSQPYSRNRLAIFHPDGNIQRSFHLDSRGDEPKFQMEF